MPEMFHSTEEKKVEYIELIYDLIFVYLISRNNSLLHTIENGFVRPDAYFTFLGSTLVILQLWYFSVIFINRYGDGRISEYVGIFVNMYLMYFMADGIKADWGRSYLQYNAAWALILLNLAAQYLIRYRRTSPEMTPVRRHMRYHMLLLAAEAVLILICIPVYYRTGYAFSLWALGFGIAVPLVTGHADSLVPVDFPHLSERVMLYVVFTFGEMILGITGYFGSGFNFSAVYFSLMAFLIVAGLFSSYGFFYNRLLDREYLTAGNAYMLLHMVMITALSHITAGMEFMREPELDPVPKTVFLTLSILAYYLCLLLTQPFSRKQLRGGLRSRGLLLSLFALFAALMFFTYPNGRLSIAVTAVFIYLQLLVLKKGAVTDQS